MSTPIGEIVMTTSLHFTAQRLVKWDENAMPRPVQPPNLGSLVWAHLPEGGRVFAVVSFGSTSGIDTGRQAIVRTREDIVDERIYHENPQLMDVLRTEFVALLVGYETDDNRLYRHLPPQPPPLHYGVYPASTQDVIQFSDDLRYLRLLLEPPGPMPGEQLLAAHVREVFRARGEDGQWMERAARQAANLLKRDYERLRAALEAMEEAS